jgi:hypothetical protein
VGGHIPKQRNEAAETFAEKPGTGAGQRSIDKPRMGA